MTDWKRMIAAIKAAHLDERGKRLTNYKLGLMIGEGTKTIARIESGLTRDPRESVATKLRKEYAQISGNPSLVPRETVNEQA